MSNTASSSMEKISPLEVVFHVLGNGKQRAERFYIVFSLYCFQSVREVLYCFQQCLPLYIYVDSL